MKAMDEQLKEKLISVLEEGVEDEVIVGRSRKDIDSVDEHQKITQLLISAGHLMHVQGYGIHTSMQGREYLYRLKHRIRAWYKGSRFLLFVAIITAATAITGVVFQIVS